MLNQSNNVKFLLCRMAEDDIIQNLDSGNEYTRFSELIKILPRNEISKKGIPYDIDDINECGHIIKFIEDVKTEEEPKLDLICGSFFSRNKQLQNTVSGRMSSLANDNIPVSVYAGGPDVQKYLAAPIYFEAYNRQEKRYPHFLLTKKRFLLELPHTEKKQVRVDLISDLFDEQIKNDILNFLGNIVKEISSKEKTSNESTFS